MHAALLIVGLLVLACSGTFAALLAGESLALENHLRPTAPRFFWGNGLERLNPIHYEAEAHEQVARARRFFSGTMVTLVAAIVILWLAFK